MISPTMKRLAVSVSPSSFLRRLHARHHFNNNKNKTNHVMSLHRWKVSNSNNNNQSSPLCTAAAAASILDKKVAAPSASPSASSSSSSSVSTTAKLKYVSLAQPDPNWTNVSWINSVNVNQDDGLVALRWNDGGEASFHLGWLYRVCNCPKCKQPHSGQIMVSPQDFPVNPKIASYTLDTNNTELVIQWESKNNNDIHESRFSSQWLKGHDYSDHVVTNHRIDMQPAPLTRNDPIPCVSFSEVLETEEGLWKWLCGLTNSGFVVLTGAPLVEETVTKAASRIGKVMHTIYGEHWHVKAEDRPINIAYSTVELGLHQDLAYYESPPALQLLHCLRFDEEVEGGESVMLDLVAAAEQLRSTNPKAFAALTVIPATFQKVHYEREHPVHIVHRRPHIWLNAYGDIIGGSWAPPFEGVPLLPASQMKTYMEAYKAFADIIEDPNSLFRITFRLRPGDILTFSNRRMLHGRNEFKQKPGAVRHLQGCYLSAEDYTSTLHKMATRFPPTKATKELLMFGSHL